MASRRWRAGELGRLSEDQQDDFHADYLEERKQQRAESTAAGLSEKFDTPLPDDAVEIMAPLPLDPAGEGTNRKRPYGNRASEAGVDE